MRNSMIIGFLFTLVAACGGVENNSSTNLGGEDNASTIETTSDDLTGTACSASASDSFCSSLTVGAKCAGGAGACTSQGTDSGGAPICQCIAVDTCKGGHCR